MQVWGNGTDVVFIWGVQLSEEEAHDWARQKIDKRKKENEDKPKEDDEQRKKEEEGNVEKEAGVKSQQEEREPVKKEEEKAAQEKERQTDRTLTQLFSRPAPNGEGGAARVRDGRAHHGR